MICKNCNQPIKKLNGIWTHINPVLNVNHPAELKTAYHVNAELEELSKKRTQEEARYVIENVLHYNP